MGLNTEKKNYTIGRGDLLFAERKADGSLGGYRPIGNTPAFNIGVQSDSVQHFSSARGMRVQDRDVPVQTTYSASFQTDDISPKNLAALFLGDAETVAISSASAVTETFTDVELGLTYQIGVTAGNPMGVRNITLTTLKVGVTTLVEGTDYTVDEERGLITLLEGGTVANADDVIATYDQAAYSQDRVASGSTVVEGALMFVAYNPEGENKNYLLSDVKLSPNGDYAIKSDNDWSKMDFKVSVNTPTTGAAIYCDGAPYTPYGA
jgi:hypothetical protein